MKEQVQKTGVRKWAGQDLVDLQHEPLAAITAFFEEYGSCVIRGCDVIPTGNTNTVTPGMVALEGVDQNGQPTFKVAPFAGVEGVTLPIYLTLTYSTLERPYADLKVKPIAYDFRAAATGVKPTDKPYLEVGVAGGRSFVDAIQDAKHRFFTDTERNKLTGIEANANNYVHPAKHPASMIEQDDQNRMVSTTKMGEWDAKATTAYVAQQIAALVASSPAALDTLNELAAALGNDPNFATTVMNALAGKAPLANPIFIGGVRVQDGFSTQYDAAKSKPCYVLDKAGSGHFGLGNLQPIHGAPAAGQTIKYGRTDDDKTWAPSDDSFQHWFDGNLFAYGGRYRVFHEGNFNASVYATIEFVKQKIAELVASSPAALDTLNELAAALGNDPNFATTIATQLGNKVTSKDNAILNTVSALMTGYGAVAAYIGNWGGAANWGVGHNNARGPHTITIDQVQGTGPFENATDIELFLGARRVWSSGNFDPASKAEANHNHDDKYQPKGSYLTQQQLENCFPSGAFSADGSKKEHFLDVICAGSVTQSGGRRDYWGVNGGNTYGFDIGKVSTGVYRITHSSSLPCYGVVVTCRNIDSSDEKDNYATVLNRNTASFDVNTFNGSGSWQDTAFDFIMYRLR